MGLIPPTYLNRRLRRKYLENCIQLLTSAADFDIRMLNTKNRCRIYRDIPYRPTGDAAHLLDIYRPENAARPLPVLMYIHGGGFTICSKDTHRNIALAYAARGHLVFNINYRLAPKHPFPAALEDVCHAYRRIAGTAGEYGGDPGRLSLAGESAGGNLVLALTVACCYGNSGPVAKLVRETGITPKAVQVLCGFLQVSEPDRLRYRLPRINPLWAAIQLKIARDVAEDYLGKTPPGFSPDRQLADPLTVMESDSVPVRPLPAIFAMAGTDDILLDDTRRLETALRRKKAIHTVKYYPNEMHAFQFFYWRKQARRFWEDSFEFLDQYV